MKMLSTLPEAALACLAEVAIRRTYAADETIFLAGEPCRAVYFIAEGQVRVYRLSPEGRKQVLVVLEPGQAFNTVPPFLSEPVTPSSAEAITPVTLYAVTRDDFLQLLRRCPDLTLVVLRDFAHRLAHLTDLVENLALHTVRGRLARFLLDQAAGDAVARRWTQDEIAEQMGTVRDMIGRALRSFADAGLIRVERGRIVLLDRAGLEGEAQC
ncbi:MAG: Crp/Fnr family transcriptional regulator [Anaerolineae bacterium]